MLIVLMRPGLGAPRHGLQESGSYCVVIRCALRLGDLETAVRLLGLMRRQGLVPEGPTWHQALEACAQRQLVSLCEALLRDARSADVRSLRVMLRLYASAGDLGGAQLAVVWRWGHLVWLQL